MANRTRTNRNEFHLDDKEQFILDEKFRLSGMKSKSAFLRKQTYYRIRKLSDELCSEHNLSVIIPGGERGKKYNEWQSDKNGAAWKTQIRKDINTAIKSSSTYEEFLLLMRAKGYEIKGESFGEDAPKYISFRPLGKDRFVRGSVKSLGREYTKQNIRS